MRKQNSVAPQTRRNWLIDANLFLSALVTTLTGVYFLFLPVGGYQGGRNSAYRMIRLFERHNWKDLHIWFGLLLITIALVHIFVHLQWIKNMGKRIFCGINHSGLNLNTRSRFNLLINTIVGLCFLLSAISSVYLFFTPGGRSIASNPRIVFPRFTWDLIHTWSGILMIIAVLIHLAIHWKWVTKVTRKMFKNILSEEFFAQSTL